MGGTPADSSTGYDYNALDQLLASTPNSGDATAYVWDALGRVATQTTGDKVQTFGWSADDHLLSVSHTTNATADWAVAYTYDHRGERVSRTDGADATRYLSDDENPTGYSQALAEVSTDATTTKANYWYADGFGPLAEAHNPGSPEFSVAFLHGDHLSTTRGLTAATTGAFSQIDYAPFGSIIGDGGSLTTQHAFTGQWKDPRSGLQHHRARWLDCNVGRWESNDEYLDLAGTFANAMSYVVRQPLNSCDIIGLNTEVEINVVQAIMGTLVLTACTTFLGAIIGKGIGMAIDPQHSNVYMMKGALVGFAAGLTISAFIYLRAGASKYVKHISAFATGFIVGVLKSKGTTLKQIVLDGIVSGCLAVLVVILLGGMKSSRVKGALTAGVGALFQYLWDVFGAREKEFSWYDMTTKFFLGLALGAWPNPDEPVGDIDKVLLRSVGFRDTFLQTLASKFAANNSEIMDGLQEVIETLRKWYRLFMDSSQNGAAAENDYIDEDDLYADA